MLRSGATLGRRFAGFCALLLLAPGCYPDSKPKEAGAPPPSAAVSRLSSSSSGAAPNASPPPAQPVQAPARRRAPWVDPKQILFVGNSFVHSGPLPDVLGVLVKSAGISTVSIEMSAESGWSLADHRKSAATLAKIDTGTWDAVVLQDLSTRPTTKMGQPDAFREDAAWFIERIGQKSPKARVILFQTWAQHPSSWVYQEHYKTFAEMTEDLRSGYRSVVARGRSQGSGAPAVLLELAPVGDAWEVYLARPNAERLHGQDGVHPGDAGKYLNALVFFRTLFQKPTAKLSAWTLPPATAAHLQIVVDALPSE